MNRSSESPEAQSPTAKLEASQADFVPKPTGQLRGAVHIVAEHDYTLPERGNESNCRPYSSLPDVCVTSQEHHSEESGRRIVKAVRRIQSAPVRRDSVDSNSSTSSNVSWITVSSRSSSRFRSNSDGSGSIGGDCSSNGTGGNSSGVDGGGSCSSTSCHSLYLRSYIPHKDVFNDPNTTDQKLTLSGGEMETEVSVPSEVKSLDVLSHRQQIDTSVPLDETTTVISNEESFFKVTRLSDSSTSTSSSSNSNMSGRRRAAKGLQSNKFIELTDINKAYLKAKDLREEAQREDNTWVFLTKCIHAVGSRVSYLHTLAQNVLADDYTPHDPLWKSDVDTSTNHLDASKCSSDYEKRLETVETCLLDAYAELASEENKEAEISSPTSSEGCSTEYIRETIKRDAELFPEESTSSGEETTNSGNDEGEREHRYEVIQACKSAYKSLKRAIRKKGTLTEMSQTAEQYVKDTKVTYGIILTCMNCIINVARSAVEADRFLQIALRKLSSTTTARAGLLANNAAVTSRLADSALTVAEEIQEYHEEAAGALSDAEYSLEEIQMNDSIGDDIVLEMSLVKDHVDMLAEEISDISLQTLRDKSDLVTYHAGSVACVLRDIERYSAGMEGLYKRCTCVWRQLLTSIVTVTKISVHALNAAAEALEALSEPKSTSPPQGNLVDNFQNCQL